MKLKSRHLVVRLIATMLFVNFGRAQSNLPPAILAPPQSVVVTDGNNTTFNVAATGTLPLTYRWQFNGTNLIGSPGYPPYQITTSSNLVITKATITNAGPYDVVVSNTWGSVTSSVATLTIVYPPAITTQPVSQSVTNTVTFTVGATGTGPLTYQWLLNGKFLPNNLISTVAGTNAEGFLGDGGAATNSRLNHPSGVAVDDEGNLFIADTENERIRKVNTNGVITTMAGNGNSGYNGNGSVATNSPLFNPLGVAVDGDNDLFIADTANERIREEVYGILITVAGTGGSGHAGDGGTAYNATLNEPEDVAVDADGNIFIADTENSRIRKVDINDTITTVAGNGNTGYGGDGGASTNAELYDPAGVAVDAQGNLYIADTGNNRVRKVGTNGIITTVAGHGVVGLLGDGGAATNATLNRPAGVAVDANGNLFIVDTFESRIREVGLNGIITTVAGAGTQGYRGDGGPATNAWLAEPAGMAVDGAGDLFIADTANNRVRKVTPQGSAYTVGNLTQTNAGNYQVIVSSPYGSVTSSVAALTVDLPPYITQGPFSESVVNGGTADFYVTAIGLPLTWQWQFNGTNLIDGGGISGSATEFLTLNGVTTSNAGLYDVIISNFWGSVTSSMASLIITYPPAVTNQPMSLDIVNGSNATLSVGVTGTGPFTYQWLQNGLYLTNGIINTVIGSSNLYSPSGVTMDGHGNVFIADTLHERICKLDSSGNITTVAGNGTQGFSSDGGAATNVALDNPYGVAVDAAGNIFFSENAGDRVRKVDVNGIITTVAGSGLEGWSGDGGAATNAGMDLPAAVVVDATGNLFFADTSDQRIRKVDTNGIITTVAGNGSAAYSGDGGPATNAALYYPQGLAIDASGNLFIGDTSNDRVRKVDTNGIITTVAGNGSAAYSGDGGPATNASLYLPYGVAVDAYGDLFIADNGHDSIREVDANGFISTVAGDGNPGYAGDGGPAVNATLQGPYAVALDPTGNLFIADTGNNALREVILSAGYPILTLNDVTAAAGGNYQVVVDSSWGSVPSGVATVNIVYPPAITNQPVSQTIINGSNMMFSVAATGTAPLSYQWQFEDTNLTDGEEFSGSATTNLVITSATAVDAGLYDVIVTNAWGSVTSSVVTLNIVYRQAITGQPVSQEIINGGNAAFSVTATGTGPLSYQWQLAGTNLTDGGEFSGSATASLVLTGVSINDAGAYAVIVSSAWGSVTSSVASLTIAFPPAIAGESASQIVINGGNATFGVMATGTGPFSYQWQLDGTNLTDGGEFAGSATTNLVLTGVGGNDAGAYDVIVSSAWGSVTSSVATLTIAYPPAMASQPASQSIVNGGSATFNVTVTGTAPLVYQWQFAGTNLMPGGVISGTASSTLALAAVTTNNTGLYDVIISSAWGSVTSSVASLTVVFPPGIAAVPAGVTALPGSNVGFAVEATGTAPLFYQWLFNGTNLMDGGQISGSAMSELLVTKITTNNAGSYRVIVTNAWGSVTSVTAALTIAVPPVITNQPVNVITLPGINATLTVGASGSAPLFYHWQFNGTNLPVNEGPQNPGSATLFFDPVRTNNAGPYDVVVSNYWGSVTSSVVTITVLVPPTITSQPASQVVTNATNVTFTVKASGLGPLAYQWLFNGKYFTNNTIATVAGKSGSGYSGDGGPATNAVLNLPQTLAVDEAGNLYIGDAGNQRVRKVTANGIISTVAGNGASGYGGNGLVATNTSLDLNAQFPVSGVAVDADDNLFIADTINDRLRVETYGILITVAGNGTYGYSGDGGAAYNAEMRYPSGVVVDANGNIYISDAVNGRIRKVDVNDVITTVAGNGTNSYSGDGGAATNAGLDEPMGMAFDSQGDLYIADTFNNRIRMINTNGVITTVAGKSITGFAGDGGAATNAFLDRPTGVAVDVYGDLYIADSYNSRIRMVNPRGIIATVAGNGNPTYSGDGVTATNASLNYPTGVAVDAAGDLYIADSDNNRIRKVTPLGPVLTLNNVTPNNAGNYQVIISNAGGSVTSSVATLTLDFSPAITLQPVSQSVISEHSAVFNVTATGTAPLAYQWQFNGTNLAHQVDPALSFNAAATNAGAYQVVITNLFGSVTSSVAALTVDFVPAMVSQPVSQTVIAGGTATFTATASGTAPLAWQWQFNSQNLNGQTNQSLVLPAVSAANAGVYKVTITSPYGTVISTNATLIVAQPQISVAVAANGGVTLNLQTAASTSSEVLAATNLVPPVIWQSIYTNVPGTNGVWQFTDTNTATYPVRFYRTSTP